MGCDIHFYVEVRKDGEWKSADKWKFDVRVQEVFVESHTRFYTERNYDLFSALTDGKVRSCTKFRALSKPRGLPIDLSVEVAANAKQWGSDGHSHSHFTLEELLTVDWQRDEEWRIVTGGFVLHTLHRMRQLGDPENVRCVFWFDN